MKALTCARGHVIALADAGDDFGDLVQQGVGRHNARYGNDGCLLDLEALHYERREATATEIAYAHSKRG